LIGTTLASYRITAKLGEGGMGVVYRATDSKLGRDVALKVLPAGFTADRERLARFEREAKLLAQLNHPNIAQVFGLEASGESLALVMELVEGPTLAELLESGPLPLEESLSIARQIAEALEEAHEKGIIHRDLKPQNIKASTEGKVKVLDFGLAKAMEASGGTSTASQLAHSPTITFGATVEGVILGTAAYMAPEQAAGKALDKRADIWAFGVVVYEMLTGRTLFAAESVPETLAAVLRADIDLTALPPETPPAVRRMLRRCLERQPKARLRDIGDARMVLEEVLSGRIEEAASPAVAAPVATAAPRTRWLPWVAGFALGALALAVADRTLLAPEPAPPPTLLPLTYSGFDSQPSISPDGRTVAFVSTRDGRPRIWIKQLSTGEEVALTEGPDQGPKFSPDGSSLLFLRAEATGFDLHRVPSVGGAPRRLMRTVFSFAWSPDGRRIAVTRAAPEIAGARLFVTAAEGGDERAVAELPSMGLVALDWSPDGRHLALRLVGLQNFAGFQEVRTIEVASGESTTVLELPGGTVGDSLAWNDDRSLLVALGSSMASRGPFRLAKVEVAGGRRRDLMSLASIPSVIDVAGPGRLVLDAVSPRSNLRAYSLDEQGAHPERWLSRGASVDRQPTYSPDGEWLAFTSDRGGSLDIWTMSTATGTVRRLTHDGADDWDPYYSPDGRHLLWSSNRGGNFEVWIAEADGSGARQLSRDGVDAENPTMTPDGGWVVYSSSRPGGTGIWKMRADGSEVHQVAAGPYTTPELSPDGRWVAASDTSTYSLERTVMRVFDLGTGAEVASVSMPGGSLASGLFGVTSGRSRWLPDGRTVVFLAAAPDNRSIYGLYAQPIEPGRDTDSLRRQLLAGELGTPIETFGISPDGRQLVVGAFEQRSDLSMIEGLPGVGER
jgi:eukaryotic-like serine/threonine-protein kinase